MNFLARIRQIAKTISGQRDQPAPAISISVISQRDEATGITYHYISAPSTSRQVLNSSAVFAQEDFLSGVLKTCNPNDVGWIRFFAFCSPEFLDSERHTATRAAVDSHLSKVLSSIRMCAIGAVDSEMTMESRELRHDPTTKLLAERIVSRCISEALSLWYCQSVHVSRSLLFKYDIFTPSVRYKDSLIGLNREIAAFMGEQAPSWIRGDSMATLATLSLLIMGAQPLASALTALFNAVIEVRHVSAVDTEVFSRFSMSPVNYVTRRCLLDCVLGEHPVRAGDILYVFLASGSRCPIRRSPSLAFGSGRHRCLGQPIAQEVMDRVIAALPAFAVTLRSRFTVSDVVTGTAAAFLSYRD